MVAEPKAQVDPDESWSEPERWAWDEIRAGKIADFHARHSKLDPKEPGGWDQSRKLSQAFLETILVREPFKGAVPRQGARIAGAWFDEPIDLESAQIVPRLWLARCRFERTVDFGGATFSSNLSFEGSTFTGRLNMNELEVEGSLLMDGGAQFAEVILGGARVKGQLSMIGSTFNGTLNMNGLQVERGLLMRDGARFAEVDLRGAKVKDQLAMIGSTFTGTLNMDGLEVDGMLLMHNARFAEVDLRGAKLKHQLAMIGSTFTGRLNMNELEVEGSLFMRDGAQFAEVVLVGARVGNQLSMGGSTFTGKLDMDSLQVDGGLLMNDRAQFAEVDLRSARVGDQLSMVGSTFTGKLDMNGLQVEGDVFMRDSTFARPITMVFASIGSNLDLRGASLGSPGPAESTVLDLTGTNVKSELMLAQTTWTPNSQLILRNTRIGAMRDHEDAWPDRLELDGFTYERLGGLGSKDPENDMGRRPAEWLSKKWLERDHTYSPQPYRQLADVLRAGGHATKANAILYAGRDRERKQVWKERQVLKWLGLSLLKVTIGYGYGYRYFLSLAWVAAFVLLGVVVLYLADAVALPWADQLSKKGMPWAFACSLDLLLPIVELNKAHAEFVMKELGKMNPAAVWVPYYFYFHKLVGWILGSFVIAGLAGLTQK